MNLNLENICLQVTDLTRKVGKFILQEQEKISAASIEVKGLNNFVTYVDKTAEQKLVEALKKIIPGSGFITEEDTVPQQKETYTWIIDPLDGTTNFIHGLPCFAISIGLLHETELVMGVVHELNRDECFYAWKDGKAYMNNKEIHVSPRVSLKESFVATGFPYHDFGRMEEYMQLFRHMMQHSRALRRLGSAATDLAYVACGRFDSFYEHGLSPWDVAAGAFIIKQAGGNVTDFKGGNDFIFGKEIIATNGLTQEEFVKTVKLYFH